MTPTKPQKAETPLAGGVPKDESKDQVTQREFIAAPGKSRTVQIRPRVLIETLEAASGVRSE